MQNVKRGTLTRICALVLALMLLLPCAASLAEASFKKSGAGVSYNGSKFKLGDTTTGTKLKKAFGSYTRQIDDGCTFGYATYLYTFKKKGIKVETLQKKKGGKEQIITIEITKKTVPTIAGLKVGNGNSVIKKKYGSKCSLSGSTARYKSGDYYMYVYTKSKKVTKIVFYRDL